MSSAAVGISSDSASSSSTPVLQRSRGVHASSKRPLSSGIGGQQVDSNHRRRIEVPTTTSTAQVGIATPPPPPAPVAIAVGVASTGAGSSSTPAAPAPRVRIRPSAYVIQERKKDTLKYTTKHYHHNACSKISNDYLQQKYDPAHPYKKILAVMPFMDLTSEDAFESVRFITFMSHNLSFHLRILKKNIALGSILLTLYTCPLCYRILIQAIRYRLRYGPYIMNNNKTNKLSDLRFTVSIN